MNSTLKEQDLLLKDILARRDMMQRTYVTQIEKMENMENEMTRLLGHYQERVKKVLS
jgi:hypothetical protein